jgi:hypothetical protein
MTAAVMGNIAVAATAAPRHMPAHHFDIAQNRCGLWRVTDRDGLIGGTFRSEKDAVRFAIDEADGDASCIHRHDPAATAVTAVVVRR